MPNIVIYPVGCTPACHAAVKELGRRGIALADHITPEATHLMLDVPSFAADGKLKSGADFRELLSLLPEDVVLIGGRLPASPHRAMDLLKDDTYQYENAVITAECALRVAAARISFTLRKAPVLIVGWGRIGKHLAFLLKAYGSDVTVLSRSPLHRAEAASFGMQAISPALLPKRIGRYRVLFNTAPGMMIPRELAQLCENCVKLDLASVPGIEGDDVIRANGLPGIHAPESAGRLIAGTVIRLLQEEPQ